MDILVKGIKATISFIRPMPADGIWQKKDQISVWLDLETHLPMGGTIGFGVSLPAIYCYSRGSFLDALTKAADKRAGEIIEQSEKERALQMEGRERLAKLQALVNDLEKELAE